MVKAFIVARYASHGTSGIKSRFVVNSRKRFAAFVVIILLGIFSKIFLALFR